MQEINSLLEEEFLKSKSSSFILILFEVHRRETRSLSESTRSSAGEGHSGCSEDGSGASRLYLKGWVEIHTFTIGMNCQNSQYEQYKKKEQFYFINNNQGCMKRGGNSERIYNTPFTA